jgi:hypothetical protein
VVVEGSATVVRASAGSGCCGRAARVVVMVDRMHSIFGTRRDLLDANCVFQNMSSAPLPPAWKTVSEEVCGEQKYTAKHI